MYQQPYRQENLIIYPPKIDEPVAQVQDPPNTFAEQGRACFPSRPYVPHTFGQNASRKADQNMHRALAQM